ncbi:trypsin-1 [Parasteatoda tepidariorum]|uniref:trypsin-1 n=1 Tax=Parasteatoda tepidariorum TaxID=114398 RepID=UPI00077F80ED|nr:trypsin-1 [Parasteatoda tepidariorum]
MKQVIIHIVWVLWLMINTIRTDGFKCGVQKVRDGRIVGGDDAFDGEFPFMVSVRRGGSTFGGHHCGGVIIKKLWILTAAHCVRSYSPKHLTVRVGEYDLTKLENFHSEEDYSIEKIILHPKLNHPKRYNNDIALLKLTKPIKYDSYVGPSCLPQEDEDFSGQEGTIMGWGFLSENGGERSNVLQKLLVPIMNITECQLLYDEANLMRRVEFIPGQVCAGYKEGKKDSCQGDSGGPLVVRRKGRFTVVGVLSAGIGCARPLLPGIYTSVPFHLTWINHTIQRNHEI